MARPHLEVGDIFRDHGDTYRRRHAGHLSLGQLKVLSRRLRRVLLSMLHQAHRDGRLQFFGRHRRLVERHAFSAYLAPLAKRDWYVYLKAPFAHPEAVLDYLGRYTHRVAIANSRLIDYDGNSVTFWHKDYRGKRVRTLLDVDFDDATAAAEVVDFNADDGPYSPYRCPACGAPMIIIESFEPYRAPRPPPVRKTA